MAKLLSIDEIESRLSPGVQLRGKVIDILVDTEFEEPLRIDPGGSLRPASGVLVTLPPAFEGSPGCLDTSAGGAFAGLREADPAWFGASPSASASVNLAAWEAAAAAVGSGGIVRDFSASQDLEDELERTTPLVVVGSHGLISQGTSDKSIFRIIDNGSNLVEHALIHGVAVTQVDASDPGTGTANNHAPFKFLGALNPQVVLSSVRTGCLGISFGYGSVGLTDRRSMFGLMLGNYLEDLEKMGLENIGSSYARIVGNAINGVRGNSNGIRLSGYGTSSGDPIEARCIGVVAAGNVVADMLVGLALQNATEHACISALHTTRNSRAIQISAGTDITTAPRYHHVTFTSHDDDDGIENAGSHHSVFDGVIQNATNIGIEELTNATTLGRNTYRGTIHGTGSSGVIIRYDRANLDLIVNSAGATGVRLSTGADGCVGKLNVSNCTSASVVVESDDNNLQIASDASGTTNAVSVPGSDNVLSVNTTGNAIVAGSGNVLTVRIGGNLTVGGDGNVITGIVTGTLTFSTGGDNNKFIGIAGTVTDNGTGNTTV